MKTAPLIARIRPQRAPYSGEIRGYILESAIPNMAGSAFGKPAPSFASGYLQSRTDHTSMGDALAAATRAGFRIA